MEITKSECDSIKPEDLEIINAYYASEHAIVYNFIKEKIAGSLDYIFHDKISIVFSWDTNIRYKSKIEELANETYKYIIEKNIIGSFVNNSHKGDKNLKNYIITSMINKVNRESEKYSSEYLLKNILSNDDSSESYEDISSRKYLYESKRQNEVTIDKICLDSEEKIISNIVNFFFDKTTERQQHIFILSLKWIKRKKDESEKYYSEDEIKNSLLDLLADKGMFDFNKIKKEIVGSCERTMRNEIANTIRTLLEGFNRYGIDINDDEFKISLIPNVITTLIAKLQKEVSK